jgi:hypothetical protein
MASSSKKKTTMAKLNREAAVRERRARKQAKKNARKQTSTDQQVAHQHETSLPAITGP